MKEEHHLGIPVIGRQRPAMAEYDGLTLAPVLVVDLYAVFGRDCRHGKTFQNAAVFAANLLIWRIAS
jgi:hypothetical protein